MSPDMAQRCGRVWNRGYVVTVIERGAKAPGGLRRASVPKFRAIGTLHGGPEQGHGKVTASNGRPYRLTG